MPSPAIQCQWLGRMDYSSALDLQNLTVGKRLRSEIPDTILLIEHDPVYTIGRTKDRSSLGDPDSLPHPVVEIGRGGQATYHGPGQLIGYPIIDLKHYVQDLHRYLRTLEQAIVHYSQSLGIPATTRQGLTGVWVGNRKLASIGVGVRNWVTLHGFSLNVCGSLQGFSAITPCGISGVEMTTLEQEGAKGITVPSAATAIEPHLQTALQALC